MTLTFDELDQRLHFQPLWDMGIKGRGATIAVLDTGFTDDDAIGKAVISAKDFTGENHPTGTEYWHGTSVAKGIRIIAPEATIANFKVIPEHTHLTRETVSQAVQFCIEEFPKYPIINLSLYFEPAGCTQVNPCSLCTIVNQAVQRGIIVVAAGGNLGPAPDTITCPGLAAESLTAISTWTKKEAAWWNDSGPLKKWWLKDFTGEFGRMFGTSFSAAWLSGGVALLKSAYPESIPNEIRQAIVTSAYNLPNAPQVSVLQCKEALDLLLSPNRYESAMSALYFNAGNAEAQRGGLYFTRQLGLALSFIRYTMISSRYYTEAAKELATILRCLSPGVLIDYELQINQAIEYCQMQANNIVID